MIPRTINWGWSYVWLLTVCAIVWNWWLVVSLKLKNSHTEIIIGMYFSYNCKLRIATSFMRWPLICFADWQFKVAARNWRSKNCSIERAVVNCCNFFSSIQWLIFLGIKYPSFLFGLTFQKLDLVPTFMLKPAVLGPVNRGGPYIWKWF